MTSRNLGGRLLLGFILAAALPLAGLAWVYLGSFETTLTSTVLRSVSAIADKKAVQIDDYINERLADAQLYAGQPHLRSALLKLAHTKSSPANMAQIDRELAALGEHGNYYDVLLIDANGNVVHSLRRETDLGTNLVHGPYRDTALGEGFRQAVQSLQTDLTRFAPYAPSNQMVSAFAITPLLDQGKVLGAIALQVDIDTLMPVVTDRTGLGQTGETVMATRTPEGVRYTVPLRYLDHPPFSAPFPSDQAAPPMQLALTGAHGMGITTDYTGREIAASWRYLPALDWGMVVKMETQEALAPLYAQQRNTLLVFFIFLLLSASVALMLGQRLVRNERTIAAQEARFRAMFGSMNDGVALYRPTEDGHDFTVLDMNPAGERITRRQREEVIGRTAREAFSGLEASGIFAALCRVSAGGSSESVHLTTYQDGRVNLWVENDVIRLPSGELLSVFKDITARKQAEDALQLYANIFEHSGEAIMVTDHANRILSVNPAFTRQTGYRLEDIAGKDPRVLSSGRTRPETYQAMWRALERTGYWQGELWDRNRQGHIYPKWAAISAIRNPAGAVTHYIASFTDISERKAAEEQIEHLAHHDSLTGLFNRYNLEIRLSQALSTARREATLVAVVFIDLDRFKIINDTLGHHVGDLLLIEVARRLRQCTRQSDIVARLGGDEFVVVLPGLSQPEDASPIAGKILHALGQPYDIGKDRLHSSPSIGISIYPQDGEDSATLMKNADTAMYHAKEQGRNNLQYFTVALNAAANERLKLERELRTAVEEGQFELHYQPQFALTDDPTGPPFGVEALIRWRHPLRGMIPPNRFIPIAEETGLIEAIGEWVLETACRQLSEWKAEGIGPLRVAVNLSAHQLRNPVLVEHIAGVLRRFGLDNKELELEITESVAMSNPEKAIEKLEALHDLGVTLAIDDFGTGYSSLAYLKRLPIQVLKLDREFVRDIETDENDAAISTATIALAHSLGLHVVAEGIETEGQSRFLREHHCDLLQGYLYGRPEPASVLNERWRSLPRRSRRT